MLAGPTEDKQFADPPLTFRGEPSGYDHQHDNDNDKQAGNLSRLMTKGENNSLATKIAQSKESIPLNFKIAQTNHFPQADHEYEAKIASLLNIDLKNL